MSAADLRDFRYFTSAKVRFCETDANGHMSNITTVIYMEQARTEFTSGLGLFSRQRQLEEGITFVLAGQSISYKSQAYYGDEIDTFIRVSRIGNSSLDMEYALVNRNTNALVSTGTSTMVYFDSKRQKSTPLPVDLAERIARFEATFPYRAVMP